MHYILVVVRTRGYVFFMRIIIFVILYTTNIMSNALLTTYPYTNTITTSDISYTVPVFPGAYIFRVAGGANGLVPVYTSMASFADSGMNDILNDKNAQILVLPGFALQLYNDVSFGALKTTVDNSGGTDFLFSGDSSGSSCKLFYKFPTGYNEIPAILYNSLNFNSSPRASTTTLIYNSQTYRIYTFTTGSTSTTYTFSFTGANNVSAKVLLVAGGGAGGSPFGGQESAGGGGAGGVAIGDITITKNVTYTCTVGNGGQSASANGGDSTLTNTSNSQVITVKGGGGGASVQAGFGGRSGGSGGGACAGYNQGFSVGGAVTGTSTIAGITNYYGNAGGTTYGVAAPQIGGGAGGGATGVGGNAGGQYTQIGGNGGNGYTWPVNGVTYAGGGGGGSGTNTGYVSIGGTGGGGKGGTAGIDWPQWGTDGTGGGGGGGQASANTAGGGGSGIIIIAVLSP